MFDALVVNASPLIFLGNAGRLELLQASGERIIVPEAVYKEVSGSTHIDAAANALINTMD